MMRRATWNKIHKDELKKFPSKQVHDDTIDAASQGFNELHQTRSLQPTWGRSPGGILVPQHRPVTPYKQRPSIGVSWGRR